MVFDMYRIFLLFFLVLPLSAQSAFVKKSSSGICHDLDSIHYEHTKDYSRFASMVECLESGGRKYSGYGEKKSTEVGDYDRETFNHWIDENNDCLNTRHELLKAKSTVPVLKDKKGCLVIEGRWIGEYSGAVYTYSEDLDIDHIVPLEWSWHHGTVRWTDSWREAFANDFENLAISDSSLNRQKGSKGPMEWLPPKDDLKCQYLNRYIHIIEKYSLSLSEIEWSDLYRLKTKYCISVH